MVASNRSSSGRVKKSSDRHKKLCRPSTLLLVGM
nr:hypothetical protein Iba_chr07aCG4630 [Ipomoea batatas]